MNTKCFLKAGGIPLPAILLLSNSAHSHPLGLTPIPSNGPYILLGGAGAAALADMSALAVQTCKKFKTLTTELKDKNLRIDLACQKAGTIVY